MMSRAPQLVPDAPPAVETGVLTTAPPQLAASAEPLAVKTGAPTMAPSALQAAGLQVGLSG